MQRIAYGHALTNMLKSLLSACLFSAAVLVSPALGCQCVPVENMSLADQVKLSVEYSDAIFVGKLERFEYRKGVSDKGLEEYKNTHPDLTWQTKMAVFA